MVHMRVQRVLDSHDGHVGCTEGQSTINGTVSFYVMLSHMLPSTCSTLDSERSRSFSSIQAPEQALHSKTEFV